MQTEFMFTTPVKVVLVTKENMQEVADWCGGKVAQTESRRKPGTMDAYVWVPTPKGTSVSWAFAGMYVTQRLVLTNSNELQTTWGVFRKDYISRNYFTDPLAAVEATWEREHREQGSKTVRDAIQKRVKNIGKPEVSEVAEIEEKAEASEPAEMTFAEAVELPDFIRTDGTIGELKVVEASL